MDTPPSFVANGPLAHQLLHPHALGSAFGAGSPLARLYERDAQIVLLGVGHGNSTSLHLAESRTRWASRHSGVLTSGWAWST